MSRIGFKLTQCVVCGEGFLMSRSNKIVQELIFVEAGGGYMGVYYTTLSPWYMFEIFILEVKERKREKEEGRKGREKMEVTRGR